MTKASAHSVEAFLQFIGIQFVLVFRIKIVILQLKK